jgi:hypothetical protein
VAPGQIPMDTHSPLFVLLASAYLITNALGLMAYAPQIWAVCRDPLARRQVVAFTWWIWTWGGITELLYAVWVAHQWAWGAMALVHALACGAVAMLGSWEKWRAFAGRFPTAVVDEPDEVQEAWT